MLQMSYCCQDVSDSYLAIENHWSSMRKVFGINVIAIKNRPVKDTHGSPRPLRRINNGQPLLLSEVSPRLMVSIETRNGRVERSAVFEWMRLQQLSIAYVPF